MMGNSIVRAMKGREKQHGREEEGSTCREEGVERQVAC